jgi:hypothetical protein
MNEEYFIHQIIEIRLDTEIDLTGATLPKILYVKPNGRNRDNGQRPFREQSLFTQRTQLTLTFRELGGYRVL